jgi:hypothetical protein
VTTGSLRVTRARGFRLYDGSGRRYLDLFRDGALLGHRDAKALTVMKAALSQGLATGLPTAWEGRLAAAIARMTPSHPSVRVFASRERALAAAARLPGAAGTLEVFDPASGPLPVGDVAVALLRPLLPAPHAAVLLPILPLTVCGAPAPVCFSGSLPADFPASDSLPGFLLAGALRGLASLAAFAAEAEGARLGSPAVERAVDGNPAWLRVGPYVSARFPASEYPRVHDRFLRAGVLLCPAYPGPSVLPGECSPGENRLLADIFAGAPGG